MKPSVFALAAVLLLLAGCFGHPPGTASRGDAVTIRYTATLANGTVALRDEVVTFNLGSGDSGLGAAFELGLLGKPVNATFETLVRAADREDGQLIERDAVIRLPKVRDVRTNDLARFGNVSVGNTFQYFGYNVTVQRTDPQFTRVVYEPVFEREPVPQFALDVVHGASGDNLTQTVEPRVGQTFQLRGYLDPLDLDPGMYTWLPSKGETLQLRWIAPEMSAIAGKDVTVKGTIVTVLPGTRPTYEPGANQGVRDSPHVQRLASATATADDGHDHAH